MPQKSTDPRDRIGVFKRFGDVPPEYRLDQYEAEYADRDVWGEYLTEYLFKRYSSDRFISTVQRTGQIWKEHMRERGRHHALAQPADVETWCTRLCESYSLKTAYNCYWVRIEDFYEWLVWHRDYPHTYQPVLMAVLETPTARAIWEEKIRRGQSK